MFYYLKGELDYRDINTCVIDCGGVGYKLTVSYLTSETYASKLGKEVKPAPTKPTKEKFPKDKFYREMQVAMTEELGRPFKINETEKGGTIELPFYNKEELADFCERILKKKI